MSYIRVSRVFYICSILIAFADARKLQDIEDGVENCLLELCCPHPFSLQITDYHNLLANNIVQMAEHYCDCRIRNDNENKTCFLTFKTIQTQFEEMNRMCHHHSDDIPNKTCLNMLSIKTKKNKFKSWTDTVTLCFEGLNVFLDDNILDMKTDEMCVKFSTSDKVTPNVIYDGWNTFLVSFRSSDNSRYEREDNNISTIKTTNYGVKSNSIILSNFTSANRSINSKNVTRSLDLFGTSFAPIVKLMETLNANLLKVHNDLENAFFTFNTSFLSQRNDDDNDDDDDDDDDDAVEGIPSVRDRDIFDNASTLAFLADYNRNVSFLQKTNDDFSNRNQSAEEKHRQYSNPLTSAVIDILRKQKSGLFDAIDNNGDLFPEASQSEEKEESQKAPIVSKENGFPWGKKNQENRPLEDRTGDALIMNVSSHRKNVKDKEVEAGRNPKMMKLNDFVTEEANPHFLEYSKKNVREGTIHRSDNKNYFPFRDSLNLPLSDFSRLIGGFDYEGLMPHEIAALKERRLSLRVKRHPRLYFMENRNLFNTALNSPLLHNLNFSDTKISGISPDTPLQFPGYHLKRHHLQETFNFKTNNATTIIVSRENYPSLMDDKIHGIAPSLLFQVPGNPDNLVTQNEKPNKNCSNLQKSPPFEMNTVTAFTSPSGHTYSSLADDKLYGIAPFLSLRVPGKPSDYISQEKLQYLVAESQYYSHPEKLPVSEVTTFRILTTPENWSSQTDNDINSIRSTLSEKYVKVTDYIPSEFKIYKHLTNGTLHLVEEINVVNETNKEVFPFGGNTQSTDSPLFIQTMSNESSSLMGLMLPDERDLMNLEKQNKLSIITRQNKSYTVYSNRPSGVRNGDRTTKPFLPSEIPKGICPEEEQFELKDCLTSIKMCKNMEIKLNNSIWERNFKELGYECFLFIELPAFEDGYTYLEIEPYSSSNISQDCSNYRIEYHPSGSMDELMDAIRICGNNASFTKLMSADKSQTTWQILKFTSLTPSLNENAVNIYITVEVRSITSENPSNIMMINHAPLTWEEGKQTSRSSVLEMANSSSKRKESLSPTLVFNIISIMFVFCSSLFCFFSLVIRDVTATLHHLKACAKGNGIRG